MALNGHNKQNSLLNFFNRKNYIIEYPQNLPKTVDFWYKTNEYGKIDRKQNAIFLDADTNPSLLKQIRNEKKTFFVLNFVADAFEDFHNFIRKSKLQGKIEQKLSNLSELNVVTAYENPKTLYLEYMNFIVKNFEKEFLSKNKKEINSFEDYFSLFQSYTETLNEDFPITFSGLLKSNYMTPIVSGLIIELSTANHSDDRTKEVQYLNDLNYRFFAKAAAKFGFFIDKNAPWRLVANVASSNMQKYMENYGIRFQPGSASNLFESYFISAYAVDLQVLRNILLDKYNNFVGRFPLVRLVEENCKIPHFVNVKKRSKSTDTVDTFRWLKFYYFQRLREARILPKPSEITQIINLTKHLDISNAVSYINTQATVRKK